MSRIRIPRDRDESPSTPPSDAPTDALSDSAVQSGSESTDENADSWADSWADSGAVEAADESATDQVGETAAGQGADGAAEFSLEPPDDDGRYFVETGHWVDGPFLSFYEHFGPTLCGLPVTDALIEGGVRTQYFECLALEEHEPGRIRVKSLGRQYLALVASNQTGETAPPPVVDLRHDLRRDPTQHYPTRALSEIRYLVIHHTGVGSEVGPAEIAAQHVEGNGWPGIGYHYVVGAGGTVHQTQDLTVVSYHARQFNPVAIGIALVGDLSSALPTASQLDSTAHLVAGLLSQLGLPADAVRGHREMVPTPCPGESFLRVWKPSLMQAVELRLEADLEALGGTPAGTRPTHLSE